MVSHDCKRYGKVTSNPVENINSAVLGIRAKHIMDVIVEPSRYISKQQQKRYLEAAALLRRNQTITTWGKDIFRTINEEAAKCEISMSSDQHNPGGEINAIVVNSSKVEFTVTIHPSSHKYRCNCNWSLDYGMPCCHTQALIGSKPELQSGNLLWFDEMYWLQIYSDMYRVRMPLLSKQNVTTKELVPPDIMDVSSHSNTCTRYSLDGISVPVTRRLEWETYQFYNICTKIIVHGMR
jgi:hypothetical protein